MSKKQTSGADALIQSLHKEGVELVFGYPGGAVLHIYDALFNQSEVEQKGRPLSKGSVWNIQVIGRVIQRINVKKFKYSQIIRIQTKDGKFLSMNKDGSNTTKEDKEENKKENQEDGTALAGCVHQAVEIGRASCRERV